MSVLLSESSNGHLKLTINRPEKLNALNVELLTAVKEMFVSLPVETRLVTITGSGEKAFVAGADIAAMYGMTSKEIDSYLELGYTTMRAIENASAPVIAVVNGFALGGGLELALACDYVVATKNAKFGQPEVNLGIIPGFGGTQRLLARIGPARTKRLVYTGEIISADDAYGLGLVDQIAPGPASEAISVINELYLSKAPLAIVKAKRVINSITDITLLPGLEREIAAFKELFQTEDRAAGMQAFLQKQVPKFQGR